MASSSSHRPAESRRPTRVRRAGLVLAVVIAAALYAVRPEAQTPPSTQSPSVDAAADAGADQWPAYAGSAAGTRYSALTQLTRENVAQLQPAWTFRTGELGENAASGESLTFEATPIHFDGRLYVSTSFGKVIALDPAKGTTIWTFDPAINRAQHYSEVTSRGVSSWRDSRAAASAPCAARIFLGTIDARLIALDARTGLACDSFGTKGFVDLTAGVDRHNKGDYQVTSPPAIFRDLVIVGSSIGDNWNRDTGNGVVRAFDARTGAPRWSWSPVPRQRRDEGDGGGPIGAANAWSVMSVDAERDLVFVPTTSPSPDFYGGLRHGANADANSVVALRASTGERVWGFQTVHHDLWDYDLAAQPALVSVTRDGRPVAAVAQATKMGAIFLLDRATGAPLFPIEERPVPQSDVPGEASWPTQPFPTKPRALMPIAPVTVNDAWGITDKDREECRALIGQYVSKGIFTPPTLQGTIMYPGNASGVNWGSVAYDPQRQLLIANTSRLATLVQLLPREQFDRERAAARERRRKGEKEDYEYGAQAGAPFGMRRRTLLSSNGSPCVAPPFGTLVAVDLASGEIKWEQPFGKLPEEHPARAVLGDKVFGVPNSGGPLVTASGLIFIGATMDKRLRAFDIESGRELWSTVLPRAGVATPMTYRAADGRQMVVIAAGGHGKSDMQTGDFLTAFALPR